MLKNIFARIWAFWGLISFAATFFIIFIPSMLAYLFKNENKGQYYFIKVSKIVFIKKIKEINLMKDEEIPVLLSYLDPTQKGVLNFRTHFYAPSKYIFGMKTDTFIFNITIVLISSIFLYLALYFELLGRVVRFFENLKFRK